MAKKVFTDESLSTFVDEVKSYVDDAASKKANTSHNHSASNITSGTLSSDRLPTVPISKGGTGATTAAAVLTNLGITATATELNKMDGVTATTTELNYVDGVTSNIQTQLNTLDSKKAKRISLTGQCQLTSYRTSVIALCKAPTDASCGGATNSYSSGQLNFHRSNGLYPPVIAIIGMGSSHGAKNQVRVRYLCSSDFSIFKPCTFTYNGVTYGGIEVKTSDAEAYNVTFVGETTFDIFGLDIYDSNQKTVLNTEVYNSISYDNAIIKSGWKDSTYSFITSENIGSQSVASAIKDGSGNVITSTYETKTSASSKLTEAKTYTDTVASGKANASHTHTIANITNLQSSLDGKQATITGGATSITGSNLTANRTLISDGSGKVAVSAVTSTELGYLDGVTSNIQTQLDGKSSTSHNHTKLTGWTDARTVATTPNTYNSSLIVSGLKGNSAINSPDGSTYSGVIGFRSWSDSSGGNAHEFAFTGNGNLYRRHGATTSWGNWLNLLDSGNYKTYCTPANIGASASSHTHNYAGSSSVGGSATSAVKLATARTIGIGTGATGTATSFDGSSNITIPITDVKESYLSWGGKNLTGSVSPISAALSSEHSANRIAYLNPAAIKVEYSNDAGSTWTDSGLGNSAKVNLVTTSNAVSVGSNSTVTTSHRTRMTFTAQDGTNGYVYTRPRKMLINVSTPHGLTVTIEAKTGVSGASWTTLGTYNLTGWSGWNDIPIGISTFGGGTNQTGNYWYMRFTFANTSVNSSYTTTKSSIIGLRLFGDTCWTRTSNMGETGHLYSYDYAQNATFPANVTATTFSGTTFTGSGVATLAEVKSYLGI